MRSKWPPFHIVINLTTQNLQLFYSDKESWIYGDEMESNEYNQRSILRNENFISRKSLDRL